MASLKVMDSDRAKSDLFSYRGEARIVVLAGTASEVTRAINLAARQVFVSCTTQFTRFTSTKVQMLTLCSAVDRSTAAGCESVAFLHGSQ